MLPTNRQTQNLHATKTKGLEGAVEDGGHLPWKGVNAVGF